MSSTKDEKISGAEIILKALSEHGVEHIFGYPGGAVIPIYDELYQQDKGKHVLVRHEQGAVHAAEGYARSTGKCGVVLVTSGPGATNAVTGLTDALLDSIPLVCFSGQVPTGLIGSDAFRSVIPLGLRGPVPSILIWSRTWMIWRELFMRRFILRHRGARDRLSLMCQKTFSLKRAPILARKISSIKPTSQCWMEINWPLKLPLN